MPALQDQSRWRLRRVTDGTRGTSAGRSDSGCIGDEGEAMPQGLSAIGHVTPHSVFSLRVLGSEGLVMMVEYTQGWRESS